MRTVRLSISQSRPHRVRAKTIGICVKGSDPPGSVLEEFIAGACFGAAASTAIIYYGEE